MFDLDCVIWHTAIYYLTKRGYVKYRLVYYYGGPQISNFPKIQNGKGGKKIMYVLLNIVFYEKCFEPFIFQRVAVGIVCLSGFTISGEETISCKWKISTRKKACL